MPKALTLDAQAAEAFTYVQSLRNRRKRAYAIALLQFYCGRRMWPQDQTYADLSYMARQAVRLRMLAIFDVTWPKVGL